MQMYRILIHNITNKIQFFCPVRSPASSCDKATAPNGINILAFIWDRILNPKSFQRYKINLTQTTF